MINCRMYVEFIFFGDNFDWNWKWLMHKNIECINKVCIREKKKKARNRRHAQQKESDKHASGCLWQTKEEDPEKPFTHTAPPHLRLKREIKTNGERVALALTPTPAPAPAIATRNVRTHSMCLCVFVVVVVGFFYTVRTKH